MIKSMRDIFKMNLLVMLYLSCNLTWSRKGRVTEEYGHNKLYHLSNIMFMVHNISNRLMIRWPPKCCCFVPTEMKLGPQFNKKDDILPVWEIPLWRSDDRLISTMGFPILVRWHLCIELGPWLQPLETIAVGKPSMPYAIPTRSSSSHTHDMVGWD